MPNSIHFFSRNFTKANAIETSQNKKKGQPLSKAANCLSLCSDVPFSTQYNVRYAALNFTVVNVLPYKHSMQYLLIIYQQFIFKGVISETLLF